MKLNIKDSTRALFVRRLPSRIRKNELRKMFSEFGRVSNIFVKRNKRKEDSDTAIIEMDSNHAVREILRRKDRIRPKNKPVEISPYLSRKELESKNLEEGMKKIYLSNIPLEFTNGDLARSLEAFGKVNDALISVKDEPKRDKDNFGFVSFATTKSVSQALQAGYIEVETSQVNNHQILIKPFILKFGVSLSKNGTVIKPREDKKSSLKTTHNTLPQNDSEEGLVDEEMSDLCPSQACEDGENCRHGHDHSHNHRVARPVVRREGGCQKDGCQVGGCKKVGCQQKSLLNPHSHCFKCNPNHIPIFDCCEPQVRRKLIPFTFNDEDDQYSPQNEQRADSDNARSDSEESVRPVLKKRKPSRVTQLCDNLRFRQIIKNSHQINNLRHNFGYVRAKQRFRTLKSYCLF